MTPTSAVAPDPADAEGFDWADAAIGAGIGLGVAVLAGWTFRLTRPRPAHEPLAD